MFTLISGSMHGFGDVRGRLKGARAIDVTSTAGGMDTNSPWESRMKYLLRSSG